MYLPHLKGWDSKINVFFFASLKLYKETYTKNLQLHVPQYQLYCNLSLTTLLIQKILLVSIIFCYTCSYKRFQTINTSFYSFNSLFFFCFFLRTLTKNLLFWCSFLAKKSLFVIYLLKLNENSITISDISLYTISLYPYKLTLSYMEFCRGFQIPSL